MNTYIAVDNRHYTDDISDIFPFAIRANNFDEAEIIFDKMKVIPNCEEKAVTHNDVRFLEMIEITAEMYN